MTCLFCDLVGFTSRAERLDPEDVRRLLRPYHERVRGELERFGGTVEKRCAQSRPDERRRTPRWFCLPSLPELHIERESEQLDAATEAADELLAYEARHAARPPAIDLAWAADELRNASRVRAWTESIAYRSLWSDAALAILDGELGRAADLFSQIGALPDEAYARLRSAERHSAEGRRAEADEQLQRALAFWRSVGAKRYVTEGEALLAAAS